MHIAPSNRLRRGRWSEPGQVYFVTTTTIERSRWFSDATVASAIASLHADPNTFVDARVLAWVLMPDHWHGLVELDVAGVSSVMHRFKTLAGHRANRCLSRRGAIWQSGFHEHALRRDESVRDAARYLVMNPVRAGLVDRVGDYLYWDAVWIDGAHGFAP